MSEDLKRIKKKYGEKMMHFCRANFSEILETEGLLPKILESKFVPSHVLYDDIDVHYRQEFINIIMKEAKKDKENLSETGKTAKELLSDAGYDLYECHSEDDIQSFKKYYSKGEELCTFNGGRLNSCIVFFAVKKNVNEIKREDFKNPERQDEYGTSVISIQFNRNNHYLSIKNRYNHTVSNPDATFSNNLDNIIPGLTKAFENDYNLEIKVKDENEISGYVLASDNRYYKNNFEENNIVYTPNNIIIDNGEVKTYDKGLYTIFDYFVLDKKNKRISLYDERLDDGLIDVIGEIERIEEKRIGEEKEITITNKKGEVTTIKLNIDNRIVEFTNNYVKNIGNYFLSNCKKLKKLNIPNVEKIGYCFAWESQVEEFISPKLREVGKFFMTGNGSLKVLETPSLEVVGDCFANVSQIESFVAPNLKEVGNSFLESNGLLRILELPALKKTGEDFARNSHVEEFIAPNLKEVGSDFMSHNNTLRLLKSPLLEIARDNFATNSQIEEFTSPNLSKVGNCFMADNKVLKVLELPLLEIAGNDFASHSHVEKFVAPALKSVRNTFMYYNRYLKVLELHSLEKAGKYFAEASQVEEFIAPNLREVENNFMMNDKKLRVLQLPSLEKTGDYFALESQVEEYESPNLKEVGNGFMGSNNLLNVLYLPSLEKAGDNFARFSEVEEFTSPNLKEVGKRFMNMNSVLKILELPVLEKVGISFAESSKVEEFIAPNLKELGYGFMEDNKSLKLLSVSEYCDTSKLPSHIKEKLNKSNSNLGTLNIPVIEQINNYSINKQGLENNINNKLK